MPFSKIFKQEQEDKIFENAYACYKLLEYDKAYNELKKFLKDIRNIILIKNIIEQHLKIGNKTNKNNSSELFIYLNYYLNRQLDNKDIIDLNILSLLLNNLLVYYKNYNEYGMRSIHIYELICTLIYILKRNNYNFILDDKSIINDLIDSYNNTSSIDENIGKWINIVIPLFEFLNSVLQRKIKQCLIKFLKYIFSTFTIMLVLQHN